VIICWFYDKNCIVWHITDIFFRWPAPSETPGPPLPSQSGKARTAFGELLSSVFVGYFPAMMWGNLWEMFVFTSLVSTAMSMSVCLSARSHISETTRPNFTKILCTLPVAVLGPSLMALWYVMYFRFCGWRHLFTQWAQWHVMRIPKRRERNIWNYCISSNQSLLNDKDHQVHIFGCAQGATSAIYDCLVVNLWQAYRFVI